MPDSRYARCRICNRPREETGLLSWTRLCSECATERLYENAAAMQTGRGPYAQWWAFKLAESVGWAPLDGAPPRP